MSKNKVDLTQENLIECILKRKGGTIVDFGFHANRKVNYHFKPLDPTDPDSPHVCNVPNEDHYKRFVKIPEAYREYFPDEEYTPVMQLPDADDDIDPLDPRNDFNDLLSVNPEDVSNDWLIKFSNEILKISGKNKQEIADYAIKHYSLEFDYKTTTSSEILRMILVERIKEERNASEAAEQGKAAMGSQDQVESSDTQSNNQDDE